MGSTEIILLVYKFNSFVRMYSKKKKIRQKDVVYDNRTKDTIPKRGYYSELVSDMTKEDPAKEICAKKRMKLILQVCLTVYANDNLVYYS